MVAVICDFHDSSLFKVNLWLLFLLKDIFFLYFNFIDTLVHFHVEILFTMLFSQPAVNLAS